MPAAKQVLRDSPLLYVALALLFATVLFYRVRDTTDRFEEVVRGHEIIRPPLDADFPELTLTQLAPEAEAAGLKVGDQIVAIDGSPVRGLGDYIGPLLSAVPGDAVDFHVTSGTEAPVHRTATVTLAAMRRGPPTGFDWTRFAIGYVALPYLCLALGFWVVAVRIRDMRAWLVLLMLLGLAEFVGGSWRTLFGRQDWFQPLGIIYQSLMANLWPLSMMLFGLYFPDRLPLDRRYPWAKWLVIVPILTRVLGTNIALDLLMFDNVSAAVVVHRLLRPLTPLVVTMHFVAISVFFAASGFRAFTEHRPDARRRLMLIHAGAAVALTPLCILALLIVTDVATLDEWMLLPLYALLFLFPQRWPTRSSSSARWMCAWSSGRVCSTCSPAARFARSSSRRALPSSWRRSACGRGRDRPPGP